MITIPVTQFKEKCLSILDHLEPEGLIISKHGKPIARLFPYNRSSGVNIGRLKGKLKISGNVFSTELAWNAESWYSQPIFCPSRWIEAEWAQTALHNGVEYFCLTRPMRWSLQPVKFTTYLWWLEINKFVNLSWLSLGRVQGWGFARNFCHRGSEEGRFFVWAPKVATRHPYRRAKPGRLSIRIHEMDDVHGGTNAAGAWMLRSGEVMRDSMCDAEAYLRGKKR